MPMTPGFLTGVLAGFIRILNQGWVTLAPDVLWLMTLCGTVYLLWGAILILARSRNPAEQLLTFAIAVTQFLAFRVVVTNLHDLLDRFAEAMVSAGLAIGGSGEVLVVDRVMLDPGYVFLLGLRTTDPVMQHWHSMSGTYQVLMNTPVFIIYGVGLLCAWVAFALLAVMIVLAVLKFKVLGVFAPLLLSLGLLPKLEFLMDSPVRALVAATVELGMLALVTGMIIPVLTTLGIPSDQTPNEWHALNMAAGAMLLTFVSWQVPRWTGALVGSSIGQALGDLVMLGAGWFSGAAMGGRAAVRGAQMAVNVAQTIVASPTMQAAYQRAVTPRLERGYTGAPFGGGIG